MNKLFNLFKKKDKIKYIDDLVNHPNIKLNYWKFYYYIDNQEICNHILNYNEQIELYYKGELINLKLLKDSYFQLNYSYERVFKNYFIDVQGYYFSKQKYSLKEDLMFPYLESIVEIKKKGFKVIL